MSEQERYGSNLEKARERAPKATDPGHVHEAKRTVLSAQAGSRSVAAASGAVVVTAGVLRRPTTHEHHLFQ